MKVYGTFAACTLLALSACSSVSLPVRGMSSDGTTWTGYFTLNEFQISADGVICAGKPSMGWGKVNTHRFVCNDGRTGTATTTRTSMSGGTGSVNFSDGTTASLNYGN